MGLGGLRGAAGGGGGEGAGCGARRRRARAAALPARGARTCRRGALPVGGARRWRRGRGAAAPPCAVFPGGPGQVRAGRLPPELGPKFAPVRSVQRPPRPGPAGQPSPSGPRAGCWLRARHHCYGPWFVWVFFPSFIPYLLCTGFCNH